MHLVIFVRGVYHQVEVFKTLAQSQFWRWERTNLKTKNKELKLVQGALRPSILGSYEYVFPEESLSEVLSVMGIREKDLKGPKLFTLRKLLCCKKIPKKNLDESLKIKDTIAINDSTRGLSNLQVDGVHIIGIGIKEDVRGEMYGYNQEAL